MNQPNYDKLVFFDTETTGFKPPYIISIAYVAYERGRRTQAQYLVCNPEWPIAPGASKVNGFTRENTQDKPAFPRIWQDMREAFEDAIWIGHNVPFDCKALGTTLDRYDLEMPDYWYCDTVENARLLVPKTEVKNYKLGTLCEHFGIELRDWHTANADTMACLKLYNKLVGLCDGEMVVHKGQKIVER